MFGKNVINLRGLVSRTNGGGTKCNVCVRGDGGGLHLCVQLLLLLEGGRQLILVQVQERMERKKLLMSRIGEGAQEYGSERPTGTKRGRMTGSQDPGRRRDPSIKTTKALGY